MPDRGRRLLSATRHRIIAFGSAAVAGLAVYILVPVWLRGVLRFVAAYDAATLTLIVAMWRAAIHADPARTRARAASDDPGRNIVLAIVFATVAAGLVSAIAILARGPKVTTPAERWEAYLLAVVAIAAGWFLVHTAYTFRYAHLYYHEDEGEGIGGIRFPETPDPSDVDFAYFAFCIGTSFAVSDPMVTDTRVRREVIGHSVISFAYNSVIIGMMINIFAGIFAAPS